MIASNPMFDYNNRTCCLFDIFGLTLRYICIHNINLSDVFIL